ncbi:hypothetical protein ACLOAV_008357 [Pseudogymnoascus australis]
MPLPASEEPPAPAGTMDFGTQPSTDYSTSSPTTLNPMTGCRRFSRSQAKTQARWTWKGTQGPTRKGHEVKHGVPIGVWSFSDEPHDERKHVLYGFIDPKFALCGRKYPERKDGSKYIGNFPSGTGTWAAKADEWLLDPHLKHLTRRELTEYVRIRKTTWNSEEKTEERDPLDKSAVAEAILVAATSEFTIKSVNNGDSARRAKNSTSRESNESKLGKSTPRGSFGEPYISNNKSATGVPAQVCAHSAKREARASAASNGSPLGTSASGEPKMASTLPSSTPMQSQAIVILQATQ